MNRNKLILVLIAVVILAGASALLFQPKEFTNIDQLSSYRNISSQELHSMMADKDFDLINVHIPYEGEIEETDAFIPYNSIVENQDRLPMDRDAKIVVYCMSGRMSRIAAEELLRMGYTNVLNLEGGMIAWKNSGYSLING